MSYKHTASPPVVRKCGVEPTYADWRELSEQSLTMSPTSSSATDRGRSFMHKFSAGVGERPT
jgi:hypothetical protein